MALLSMSMAMSIMVIPTVEPVTICVMSSIRLKRTEFTLVPSGRYYLKSEINCRNQDSSHLYTNESQFDCYYSMLYLSNSSVSNFLHACYVMFENQYN